MATSPFKLIDMALKLEKNASLTAREMTSAMERLVSGESSDSQIEQFLSALRKKGESAVEITAAAKVMRKHAVKLPKEIPDLLDTDRKSTRLNSSH